MLEKKAGAILNRLIDWQLYNDNKLIIDLKDVTSLYKEGEYLEFIEDNIKNIIDIKNNLYKRISDEYEMSIDFNDNICYFILPNREEVSTNVDGSLIINDNDITVIYSIDDEKRILIKIKD